MEMFYAHFSEWTGNWPWPHFTPEELACRCCGELAVIPELMDKLELLRTWTGAIALTSAHRCPRHNHSVGGAPASRHLGLAFDCARPVRKQPYFAALAAKAGFTGIIQYPERGFVHLDGRARPYAAAL
jgi:uncharacterized protein YcbK (DUF882 family)